LCFLKLQNDLFWKHRDEIDKELSNDGIKALLEHNNQTFSKAGRDDVSFFLFFDNNFLKQFKKNV
jgi:hypothetical protein